MPRKITGQVTSVQQNKTIVITVTNRRAHPLYGKQYTRSRKYMVHDEENQAKTGDTVQITECRPISKHKSFRLESIIETGHEAVELKDESLVEPVLQEKTFRPTKEKEESA